MNKWEQFIDIIKKAANRKPSYNFDIDETKDHDCWSCSAYGTSNLSIKSDFSNVTGIRVVEIISPELYNKLSTYYYQDMYLMIIWAYERFRNEIDNNGVSYLRGFLEFIGLPVSDYNKNLCWVNKDDINIYIDMSTPSTLSFKLIFEGLVVR